MTSPSFLETTSALAEKSSNNRRHLSRCYIALDIRSAKSLTVSVILGVIDHVSHPSRPVSDKHARAEPLPGILSQIMGFKNPGMGGYGEERSDHVIIGVYSPSSLT